MWSSSIFTNLRYSAENTSGGGCPKLAKRKWPSGSYFAIQHGGDFARTFFLGDSQSVPGGHRLREPQVEVFQQHGRRLAVSIQFSEHKAWNVS